MDVSTASPLTTAAERFIDELDDIVRRLPPSLLADHPIEAVGPLADAFQLTRALIDVDGMLTDEELTAFAECFTRHRPSLLNLTPGDMRRRGVFRGARRWLNRPSPLFEALLAHDATHGTGHAWRYHDLAVALAQTVASLDDHVSHVELNAIEGLRDRLGQRLRTVGVPRPSPTRPEPDHRGSVDSALCSPEDVLAELDELVGLEGVKRQMRLVSDLVTVGRLRRERGLPSTVVSHHMAFVGNPGTGKTTVARLVARLYRSLGVLSSGHLVETDRAGLVAGYMGQTAARVDEVVERALDGVLLIDEAYSLTTTGSDDAYGREAVDALVKRMEDHRDRLVVIVTGYPTEMEAFLASNPGLRSRFGRIVAFEDYDTDALREIFERCARRSGYEPTPSALDRFATLADSLERGRGFGNGRLARRVFERAVERHASRLMSGGSPTDEDLVTLRAVDLPDSPP